MRLYIVSGLAPSSKLKYSIKFQGGGVLVIDPNREFYQG